VAAAVCAACCAEAIVGVAISATDAVAAINPLKPTSASPFVLESDLLDFDPYLVEASLAVYPEMSVPEIPEAPRNPHEFTKAEPPNAMSAKRFNGFSRVRLVVAFGRHSGSTRDGPLLEKPFCFRGF